MEGGKKFDDYWTLLQADDGESQQKATLGELDEEDEVRPSSKTIVAAASSAAVATSVAAGTCSSTATTRSRCNSFVSDSSPLPSLPSSSLTPSALPPKEKMFSLVAPLSSSSFKLDVRKHLAEERERLGQWTLMPAMLAEEGKGGKPIASMVYPGIFLLRLFVKMPIILGGMRPAPKNAKLLLKYFQYFLDYLEKNLKIKESDYIRKNAHKPTRAI